MPNYPQIMGEITKFVLATRVEELTEYVSLKTLDVVQSGPFQGMKLPREASWGTGDYLPKVLGTYEQELHPAIEKAIARNPRVVFNVGCAEGYYAVGLALRLPKSFIQAFDTDYKAHSVCFKAFAANPDSTFDLVGNRFELERVPDSTALPCNSLIVMDVEGAEKQLLPPDKMFHVKHSDLIIECHDFIDNSITGTLASQLSETHDIEIIVEGSRNPNAIPLLQGMASWDRWACVCENRPCMMHWLVAWAKERV